MKKELILFVLMLAGAVCSKAQESVDFNEVSLKLKKSDYPFSSQKVMAYEDFGVKYKGKSFATYRDLSRKLKQEEETNDMYVPFWSEGCRVLYHRAC